MKRVQRDRNDSENEENGDENSLKNNFKIEIKIDSNYVKTISMKGNDSIQELEEFYDEYEIPLACRKEITNSILKELDELGLRNDNQKKTKRELVTQKSFDDIKNNKVKKKENDIAYISSRYNNHEIFRKKSSDMLKKQIEKKQSNKSNVSPYNTNGNINYCSKSSRIRTPDKNLTPKRKEDYLKDMKKQTILIKENSNIQKMKDVNNKSFDIERRNNINKHPNQRGIVDKQNMTQKIDDITVKPKISLYNKNMEKKGVNSRLYQMKKENNINRTKSKEYFKQNVSKSPLNINRTFTHWEEKEKSEENISQKQKQLHKKRSEKLGEIYTKNLGEFIFYILDSDKDGIISKDKVNIASIPKELFIKLKPIFDSLQQSQKKIDKENFLKLIKVIPDFNLDYVSQK